MNSFSLLSSYTAVRVRQCLYLLLFFGTVSTGFSQGIPVKVVFLAEPSGSTTANQPFATQPVVEIQDGGGSRVFTSATVTVSIAMNGGIFTPGTLLGSTTLLTVNGRATFSGLSIDKIGTYTLKVTSAGLTTGTTGIFTIIAGAPYRLVFHTESENGIVGIPLNPQLVVRVQDEGGNHVGNNVNTAVLLSVASGPEGITSIEQNPAYTFAGFATFSGLTLNTVGCYTLQASTSGLVSATSAAFCIVPGAASITTSTVSAATNVLAVGGSTSAVIVQLKDIFGNDVGDNADCVRLFVTFGPGSVTQIPTYDGSGRWTSTYTSSGIPGEVSVSAFLKPDGQTNCAFPGTGYAALLHTAQLNVIAGVASATTSTITAASAVVAESESTTLTITLRDSFGNPTTNGTIILAITQGGGSLSTTAVSGATTTASVVYTAGSNTSVATITARITGEDIINSPLTFVIDTVEQKQPCEIDTCKTGTLLLHTGFDHENNKKYGIGSEDKYWALLIEKENGFIKEYAYVDNKANAWPDQDDSRWLWRNKPQNGVDNTQERGIFFTLFESCEEVEGYLELSMAASDTAGVLFNGELLVLITYNPRFYVTKHKISVPVKKGRNSLAVVVAHKPGTARSLNLQGTISTPNAVLVERKCLPNLGKLSFWRARVEKDENDNGQSDSSDTPLGGVIVTITGPSTTTQATTTSDGECSFLVHELGTYTVQVEPPVGYCVVYGTTHTVTFTGNDSIPQLVSGVSSSAQVCIQKFHDQNGNGVQDGGEPNLSNWTFVIFNGTTSMMVTTGTTGTVYAKLATGNWMICEVTQAGWLPTTYICTTITVSACGTTSVTFGNITSGTASGLIIHNENAQTGRMTPAIGTYRESVPITATREQELLSDPQLKSTPNPTSSETMISYILSQPATVRLDLYTMIGRHIALLDEGQRTTGEHTVPVDLRELPSGLYHVRLTVNNRVYTLIIMSNK